MGRKVWNLMVLNKTGISERSPLGIQAEEIQEWVRFTHEIHLTIECIKGNFLIIEVAISFRFVFLVRSSDT